MTRNFKPLLNAIALLVLAAGGAVAIRMSPAAFTAQNVPIGEEFDLRVPLVVQLGEGAEEPMAMDTEPVLPSQVRDNWLEGYEEIPDPYYLIVGGEKPIIAHPDSPAIRPLMVYFPEDSSFLNRRFLAQLRVSPSKETGMFQAVLVGSYLLELVPSDDRFARPGGGPVAVAPSVIELDENGGGIIRIYNNSDQPHRVEIDLEIPPENEGRLIVELSRGFVRGDPGKFKISEKNPTIEAGEHRDIEISVKDSEYLDSIIRNTEIILWLRTPDAENASRFVRVHFLP